MCAVCLFGASPDRCGSGKSDLEKAFFISGTREKYDSAVGITKVNNIAQAISDVLQADLRGWQHPLWPDGYPAKPRKAHREEFYQWLRSLSFGERFNNGKLIALDPMKSPAFVMPGQEECSEYVSRIFLESIHQAAHMRSDRLLRRVPSAPARSLRSMLFLGSIGLIDRAVIPRAYPNSGAIAC